MKEEMLDSNNSASNEQSNHQFNIAESEIKYNNLNSKSVVKSVVKLEHSLHNRNDSRPSHHGSFSWPSLWKNGPRRSAFQPYKPNREAPSNISGQVVPITVSVSSSTTPPAEPRPASTTVMTNLQRGNIQAEAAPAGTNMSWFILAGRGDITEETLKEMIVIGKDIDCVDEEGLSGMMWAAFHGQIHTVQILLEFKVQVDRQGMWGETALMLAATEGHLEIVRLLINAGANVNHEDHCRSTPLMCAVYSDHPHTVSELLMNGADMWLHNRNNYTAYDIAVNQKSYRSKAVMERYISSLITGS